MDIMEDEFLVLIRPWWRCPGHKIAITVSQLVTPLDSCMPQGTSDSDAFAYLRKESLDIYNRIHSIADDINFVERVQEVYPNLPILRALFRILLFTPQADFRT